MGNYEHLRPLGNRVLVRRLDLPETVESGLYLIGRDYPTMGKILAVGNGSRTRKPQGLVYNNIDLQILGSGVIETGYRRPIDLNVGSLVSWRIGPNFDQYDLGDNLLLLPYSELNFVLESN